MKKFLKSLTVAIFALVAAVACIALAGCNGNSGNDDNTTTADYTFIIQYKDGTRVNGQTGSESGGKVFTQICLVGEGCKPLGPRNIYPNENGELTLSQQQVNEILNPASGDATVFVFHACDVKNGKKNSENLVDSEVTTNGKGTYTVTVD